MNTKFTIIYVFLILISTAFATYFFSFSVQHPYIGALVNEIDGEYKIAETEPNTWSRRNLQVGDVLVKVNGSDPNNSEPIKNWGMLEQAKKLTIQDAITGEVQTLYVETEIDTQMIFQLIVPVIVFLLSLYCTYFIYKSSKASTKNSSLLLILFLLDIAVAYINGGASARGEPVARTTVTFFFVLVPIFYLHFIYYYFKELNSVWFSKNWIYFSYFLVFLNTLPNILSIFLIVPFGINVIIAKALNLTSFMVLFILAFSLIFIGFKKVTYKAQKYLIKVLIFTNVLAFSPFVLLYVFPYIFFQKQIFSPVILAGFLLIIPFSLVYQFLATKIYDIDFILGRIRYYAFLSLLPALLGIFLIITTKSQNATIFTIRGFIIISLIMFIGFYLKEVVDFKFKLKRISEKHNYQDSIFAFTQKIRIANEFDEVIKELKIEMLDTLIINKIYVVELNKDKSLHQINPSDHYIFEEYRNKIVDASTEVGSIIEVDKGFVLNIGESHQKIYSFIGLSDINTPKLTRDELSWLQALAYYTNVTMDNFLKIEQFMDHLEKVEEQGKNSVWLNRVIYQLEEKQRSLLAKDLHDSVLQDLLSIKRKLEANTTTETLNHEEVYNQQEMILKDMNKVIDITRETCHELRPNILFDLGLDKAINKLVEQHIDANGYNIRFTSNKIDEHIHPDIQLNLYRISQELLNNTRKHSNAKNIVLMLVKIKDKIVLHYEDDGVGANPSLLFGKKGSMGLSGVRERVTMLNGTIDVKTGINQGFKVLIEL